MGGLVTAYSFIVDAAVVALAAWLFVRPPGWLSRRWNRGPTVGLVGALAGAAIVTLVGALLAFVQPTQLSAAARFQVFVPFLAIDLVAAAMYRDTHRQPPEAA